MKILQLHNSYIYKGGEDVVVSEEKKLLEKKGHKVTQLIRKNRNELKNFFSKANSIINCSYSKKSYKLLENNIGSNNFDIAHVHNIFPLWSFSIFQVLKKKNIPIVMSLHNFRLIWDKLNLKDKNVYKFSIFKNSRIKTFLISNFLKQNNELLENVDRFIVLSNFSKEMYLKHGFPENKVTVKPNFLEFDKQPINPHKKNAIYVSRIEKEKGILTLLKAWKNTNLILNIYGDGPLLEKLKKTNTNHKIIFHGYKEVEKINEEIKNSKYLIFPTELYENMPMTILQAFRAGTLVLASNIGSIKNIIKNDFNGILFETGDHKDLSKKLSDISENSSQFEKITQNALKDFESNFTEDKNYEYLIKIYKDTIEDQSKNKVF